MAETTQAMVDAAAAPTADATAPVDGSDLAAAIRRYQSPLLRYTQQMLRGRPDQAQDVVQDTFLKLHTAMRNGNHIQNLQSWLYRVAHNLAIDLYRRRSREVSSDAGDPDLPPPEAATVPDGTNALCRRESCRLAMAALAELPERQRQILLLKTMQEMTLQQIAEIVDLPLSTVHYQLGSGLKELARQLKAKGALYT